MKTRTVIVSILLTLCVMTSLAQDAFEKDIIKLQQVNGSAATYDMVFNQLKAQMKMQAQMKNAPEEVWTELQDSVFKVEITNLNSKIAPIYKKHFSHDEITELIKFYESPIGKKMSKETPLITQESMQISQKWAMGLMKNMNDFMADKGYGFKSIK